MNRMDLTGQRFGNRIVVRDRCVKEDWENINKPIPSEMSKFSLCKCTNCGATLTVDNDKEAAICQYCNSAFIVEKAINNYNITNNINANVVNIYGSDTGNNRDFVIEAGKLISYKGSSADVVIPDEVFLIGRNAFTKPYYDKE